MPETPLKGTSILMLEDDFWQAQDARDHLEEAGAKVVTMTGSASAALGSLDRHPVDVGLLDVNLMGHMSYDFARTLLQRGVPVMFLTGYEADTLPVDLAMTPIMTKPTQWPLLISQLKEMVANTALR
jgi:CheY-like chemotaxis protein